MASTLGKLAIISLTYKGYIAIHKIPNFIDIAVFGCTYDSLAGPIIFSTLTQKLALGTTPVWHLYLFYQMLNPEVGYGGGPCTCYVIQ